MPGERTDLLFRIDADADQAIKEFGRVKAAVPNTADLTKGLGGVTDKLDANAGAFRRAASAASVAGVAFNALGGLALSAAGGIFKLVKDASDAGSEIFDLGKKTGLTTETLSSIKVAAEQSGSSIGEFSQGMSAFNRLLGEAAAGSDEAAEKLKRFGLDPRSALLDLEGTLGKVLRSIASLPTEQQRAIAATQLFGKSGAQLSATFDAVGGDLEAFKRQIKDLGLQISTEAAEQADQFGDELTKMGQQAQAAAQIIARQAMPSILRAFGDLDADVEKNRATFERWGKSIADAVDYFSPFLNRMQEVADALDYVDQKFKDAGEWTGKTLGTDQIGKSLYSMFGTGDVTKAVQTPGLLNIEADNIRIAAAIEERKKLEQRLNAGVSDILLGEGKAKRERRAPRKTEEEKAQEKAVAEATRLMERQEEIAANLSRELQFFGDTSQEAATKQALLSAGVRDFNSLSAQQALVLAKHLDVRRELLEEQRKDQESTARINDLISEQRDRLEALAGLKNPVSDMLKTLADPEVARTLTENQRAMLLFGSVSEQVANNVREGLANLIPEGLEDRLLKLSAPNTGLPPGVAPSAAAGPVDMNIVGPPPDIAPHLDALKLLKETGAETFGALAQGMGSVVQSWVLLGNTAGQGARKMAAGVIAGVAAQSAVKAVFELAEGLAATARAFFGDPLAAAQAALHYQSAAIYGSIAGVAAVAGRAMAGQAFKNDARGADGVPNQSRLATQDRAPVQPISINAAPREVVHRLIIEPTPDATVRHLTENVRSNGEVRGLIIETANKGY